MADVSRILSQIESGDRHAADELLPLVYEELRKLAAARLTHEKPGQTLGATALVHDDYLRLVGPANRALQPWEGRGYFIAAAAEAMRPLLIEQARRKRLRHGGGRQRIHLESRLLISDHNGDASIDVDEALERLATEKPQTAEVVNFHHFAGHTIKPPNR